jgi:hypothetical protein
MGLNFAGQFYGCVGIANHARSFGNALIKYVPDIKFTPIFPEQKNDYGMTTEFEKRIGEPVAGQPSLVYWYPYSFSEIFSKMPSPSRKIGYYIFEYNKIPVEYIDEMNKLDDVCTPSPWGVEVLKNNGLTVPCHAIRGGVDTSIFNSKNRNPDSKKFRFLHIGKKENRKSTEMIVQAFANVFGGNRKVRLSLYINNFHIPNFNPSDYVFQTLSLIGKESVMKQIDVCDFEENIVDIYNRHHVAVLPSKSEGIGLPALEGMACGLPVITTFNSAMMDYANDKNSILIKDLKEEEVYDSVFFKDKGLWGTWMTPSLTQIEEKMKWAFESHSEAIQIGENAEKWVADNYTWDKSAKAFFEIL